MAHKKSWWTAQNIHDSPWQRLWIKKFWGQKVIAWNIIARQRGTKWRPWEWTWIWKDHTIYARIDWIVHFAERKMIKFNWRVYKDIFIIVKPENAPVKWKVVPAKKSESKKISVKKATNESKVSKKDEIQPTLDFDTEISWDIDNNINVEEKTTKKKAPVSEKKTVKKAEPKEKPAKKTTKKSEWSEDKPKKTAKK